MRERERCTYLPAASDWGLNPQPGQAPHEGIEPVTPGAGDHAPPTEPHLLDCSFQFLILLNSGRKSEPLQVEEYPDTIRHRDSNMYGHRGYSEII